MKQHWHYKRYYIQFIIGIFAVIIISSSLIYLKLSKVTGGFASYDQNRPDYITVFPKGYSISNPEKYYIKHYDPVTIPVLNTSLQIRGWYMPHPTPSDTLIIFLSGHDSSRKSPRMLITSGMLWHAGFTTLVIDFRDQGDSDYEDGRTALGSTEYNDVLSAIQWAKQNGYHHIGLVGFSMGASIALITAPLDSTIKALWLDSPFAHRTQIVKNALSKRHIPSFLAWPTLYMGSLLSGDPLLDHQPIDAITHCQDSPIYIVHSHKDLKTPVKHSLQLIKAAQTHHVNVQSWLYHHKGHAKLIYDQTSQYNKRLVHFFKTFL
jgi:dipeptidyl aminopeptidase/acylaminoacyl peptidase